MLSDVIFALIKTYINEASLSFLVMVNHIYTYNKNGYLTKILKYQIL